jgi:hypothetical protein
VLVRVVKVRLTLRLSRLVTGISRIKQGPQPLRLISSLNPENRLSLIQKPIAFFS